jgi:hypothetical protein
MNPNEELVLALPAMQHQLINFLHLELEPEEIDVVPIQAVTIGDPVQDINQVNKAGEEHLNVGMALLPNSIDFDPRLRSHCANNSLDIASARPKANTTRLWAKHFSPHMAGESIQIPTSWSDFITMLLLNPSRFEWANSREMIII